MKTVISTTLLMLSINAALAQKSYLLVGTYTTSPTEGINIMAYDSRTGSTELISTTAASNPSYLAISPDQQFVYSVNEDGTGNGKVSAFRFSQGRLTLLNQQSSRGDHPCYITVDGTGKWVIAGNYSSGNLAVFPIAKDGGIGAATTVLQHSGSSVTERQTAPHVHATVLSADNKFLFVPDLGIDKLMIYHFDEKTGALTAAVDGGFALPAGSGPRHFIFHPDNKTAYLLNELSGQIAVLKWQHKKMEVIQSISSIPAGFQDKFTSADIHISADGKFVYSSNRDHSNTIGIFRVDRPTGKLTLVGHQDVMGKTPRNFGIDPSGKHLLVANQNSNEIVIFNRDEVSGKLHDSGQRISVNKPVCVKWISAY